MSYRQPGLKLDRSQRRLRLVSEVLLCTECRWIHQKEFHSPECHVPDPTDVSFVDGTPLFKNRSPYSSGASDCKDINTNGKCGDYEPSEAKLKAEALVATEDHGYEEPEPRTWWQFLFGWLS